MDPSALEWTCQSAVGRHFRTLGPEACVPANGIAALLAHSMVCGGAMERVGGGDKAEEHAGGALRWECAAARVIAVNARIAVLAARAEAGMVLPEPLDLAVLRLADVESSCRLADQALARLEDLVREHSAREALRGLADRSPAPPASVLAAARALAAGRLPRSGRSAEQVLRRLAVLDPQAPSDLLERVLETAARAIASRSAVASRSYADQLISLVRVVNAETAQRRAEVLTAARYLQVLSAVVPSPHPRGGEITARLAAVLAGHARLSGGLQDAAERLRGELEEQTERSFLTESGRQVPGPSAQARPPSSAMRARTSATWRLDPE